MFKPFAILLKSQSKMRCLYYGRHCFHLLYAEAKLLITEDSQHFMTIFKLAATFGVLNRIHCFIITFLKVLGPLRALLSYQIIPNLRTNEVYTWSIKMPYLIHIRGHYFQDQNSSPGWRLNDLAIFTQFLILSIFSLSLGPWLAAAAWRLFIDFLLWKTDRSILCLKKTSFFFCPDVWPCSLCLWLLFSVVCSHTTVFSLMIVIVTILKVVSV